MSKNLAVRKICQNLTFFGRIKFSLTLTKLARARREVLSRNLVAVTREEVQNAHDDGLLTTAAVTIIGVVQLGVNRIEEALLGECYHIREETVVDVGQKWAAPGCIAGVRAARKWWWEEPVSAWRWRGSKGNGVIPGPSMTSTGLSTAGMAVIGSVIRRSTIATAGRWRRRRRGSERHGGQRTWLERRKGVISMLVCNVCTLL